MPKRLREYDDDIYAMRVEERLTIVEIARELGVGKSHVSRRLIAMGANTVSARSCRSAIMRGYVIPAREVIAFNRLKPL